METDSIAHSNPSVISRMPIVHIEDNDISSRELWVNYIKHSFSPFFKTNQNEMLILFEETIIKIFNYLSKLENQVNSLLP